MSGTFYFFINHSLANGFGHMGWGFENGDGSCTFGSTEHIWKGNWSDPEVVQKFLKYICIPPGTPNDYWSGHGSKDEMLDAMRYGNYGGGGHFSYDDYKPVSVDNPNPQSAKAKAASQADRGWCLITNNCLDHATDIAEAYGVGWNAVWPLQGGPMPWKQTHPVPNDWYNTLLPHTEVSLHTGARAKAALGGGGHYQTVQYLQSMRVSENDVRKRAEELGITGKMTAQGALGFVMCMTGAMADGKSWDEAFAVCKNLG